MQISDCVRMVNIDGCPLAIMEPELDLSLRLAFVDDGLASSSCEINGTTGRLGSLAQAGALT